jgi:hypothetical protein
MTYRSRFFPSRFVVTSFAASSTLALVLACTANGGGDGIVESDDASPTEPPPSQPLPPSRPDDGGNAVPDAGKDASKDAAKDAAKDSAVDAGKPAPNTGDACKTVDEIFKRMCGICGTQESICLAKPDGTPDVVSDYSGCVNELATGCQPGATETAPCGNCGTQKRTCNQYCAWTTAACAGEPVNSCTPTAQDFTGAGCPAGGVRTRSCGDLCSWSNYSATCDALGYQLVVPATPGDLISAIYPLKAAMSGKRMTGTCPNPTFSTTTNHPYVYIELVNPTEATLTLSAWNTAAPNGGPVIDTLMAWYAGGVPPADEAARKTCAKGVIDACPSNLTTCGDFRWAGVSGASAIVIPPFGSSTLYFGSYYPAGGASVAEGNVKLVVRTDTSL